jgi:guanosine-3',5'-bis(diphosphate) 3'-pyrophosphohydrolase
MTDRFMATPADKGRQDDTRNLRRDNCRLVSPAVAALVLEVSDNKSLLRADRQASQIANAPNLSPGAKLIKLAGKTSNLRSVTSSPPTEWSTQRRFEYVEFAQKVVDGLAGANPRACMPPKEPQQLALPVPNPTQGEKR